MRVRSLVPVGLVAVVLAAVVGASVPVAAAGPRHRAAHPAAHPAAGLTVVPVLPTRPPLALGVSRPDGRDLSQLDAFRASIGGLRVATWTVWTQWGREDFSPFPLDTAIGIRQRHAVPLIWWEPITPSDWSDPTYTRNLNIADGRYDDYIRSWATAAKQLGTTVLIRFAHQPNSNYLPWGWDYSETDDNTPATFIKMWRHVVKVFRDEGAFNVKWVWSIATQTCNGDCLTRPLGYPGDRWVDYMAFTLENWGQAGPDSVVPSKPTITMLEGFAPVVRRLMKVSDKPIIAVATASSDDGGIRPQWIRRGYPAVYRWLPRVVAIMWLNVDLSGSPSFHRDWSLSGDALTAYAGIAAQPRFQGRMKPWFRD